MERFASRPMTAGHTLARLGSAHRSPASAVQRSSQHVQMREFGDRQSKAGGLTMTFHSQARPASAGPAAPKAAMVYSTINKDLKIELKKHVPLYKHREMGHILYKETASKIVRPKTALSSYKGLKQQPQIKHLNLHPLQREDGFRLGSRGRQTTVASGARLHIKPEHFLRTFEPQKGPRASIMGVDWQRDDQLNGLLHGFLRCNKIQTRDEPFLYRKRKQDSEQARPPKQPVAEQSHAHEQDRSWRKQSRFTVLDTLKRQQSTVVYRSQRVQFENDSNFVTLARVYN